MIDELLPSGVACAERFEDVSPGDLFPAEEALIARALDKRRREFTTGRWCARRALEALGYPGVPILRGDGGAPGWPVGVAGSITHCAGYRAAAVAATATVLSVGVDAEPDQPLPSGVLEWVALPGEQTSLVQLAADHPAVGWGRLLFSAKESVYKAWFPLAHRWLGFTEAEVDLDPGDGRTGTFLARLLVDGPEVDGYGQLAGFSGRWLVDRGLLLTAVTLPAPVGA